MFLRLGLGIMVISLLTGCTTLSKPVTMTSDPLNGRVDRIEQRLEKRDRDIAQLKFMVEEMVGDVARLTQSVKPRQAPTSFTNESEEFRIGNYKSPASANSPCSGDPPGGSDGAKKFRLL